MEDKKLNQLTVFGEISPLMCALTAGVAGLITAPEAHLRPHVCLNDTDGVATINRIAALPADEANVRYTLTTQLIHGGGADVWLNVRFYLMLLEPQERYYQCALLTPRQTSHIVLNLPDELRSEVVERTKQWYVGEFMPTILRGFEHISRQFTEGDPLLADDHRGRIFDIHGGRSMDVPYTEWELAGGVLFLPFHNGATVFESELFQPNRDGYAHIDHVIAAINEKKSVAAKALYELVRSAHAMME